MTEHQLPPTEIQVFRNVVSATGRDPATFTVDLHPDGQVHVTGPQGSAFYPPANWLSRFSRQLERGFFGPDGSAGRIRTR